MHEDSIRWSASFSYVNTQGTRVDGWLDGCDGKMRWAARGRWRRRKERERERERGRAMPRIGNKTDGCSDRASQVATSRNLPSGTLPIPRDDVWSAPKIIPRVASAPIPRRRLIRKSQRAPGEEERREEVGGFKQPRIPDRSLIRPLAHRSDARGD